MKLRSLSFAEGEAIPERYAFARIDPQSRVALADNYNPHLAWDDVPAGTRSFALVCVDPDVPKVLDDVNQEGREVAEDLPRVPFYHWSVINLSGDLREIEEGAFSSGITPRGKGGPLAPLDARQGLNDYTAMFSADRDMNGEYFGYDGPCPPWNDAKAHRYIFTLYALRVDALPLDGRFKGPDVLREVKDVALAEASISGWYTLNPRLAPKQVGSTTAT